MYLGSKDCAAAPEGLKAGGPYPRRVLSLRINPFSAALGAGFILLLVPVAVAMAFPIDVYPLAWIMPLGALLIVAGAGGLLYRSWKSRSRPADPIVQKRRQMGLGLVAAAFVGYLLLHVVGPYINYGPPALTADGRALQPQGGGEWFALIDPQVDSTPVRYDVANDTTLVLAGDGHKVLDYAVRLRGDHRSLGSEYRLVIAPEATPMPTTLWPLDEPLGGVDRASDAVFVVRSLAPSIGVHFLLPLLGASGIAVLSLTWPSRALWGSSGSVAGSAFAWMRLDAGFGLLDVIFILPGLVLLGIVAIGLLINTDPNSKRRLIGFWILAFAASAILFASHLVDAFPTDPDA